MGLEGDLTHDLLVERDSAGWTVQLCQQLVVKAFAPSEPVPVESKCYPRHKDQVQMV
jgi:hypothetical protein